MAGSKSRPVAFAEMLRGAGVGSDSALEEVASVLESHEQELQSHFNDWVSDLSRMQREHARHLRDLSKRLRSCIQHPLPPLAADVPVEQLVVAKPSRTVPPGTPPVVMATAWAESSTPQAARRLPNVTIETGSTEVVELKLDGRRRSGVSSIDAETEKPKTEESPQRTGGGSTSRFKEPLQLLYGVERTQQQIKSKGVSNNFLTLKRGKTLNFKRMMRPKLEGSTLQRFVRSMEVRVVCSTVILANAIFMGIHAQEQLQALLNGKPGAEPAWEHAETGFCIFFIAELGLRVVAERLQFLTSEDAPWNLFDTFLVVLSIVDIVLTEAASSSALNFTFARTLRIFRFARILRLVRVMRFFYSFRLMVYSVLYSIVSLLWVFVMLLFVIYFFAIFFLHGVAEYFKDPERLVDAALQRELETFYGTVPNALLSLFMGISGGVDWIELKDPLSKVSRVYGWVFLFYIFFMVFGVLNVVMASFVDSATQISRKDRELVTQNEMERQKQYAANIRRFFHEADVDKTGTLSWEEFEKYLQSDKVRAYFQSFELDVSQARTLFKLLDLDESNDVGIDEFVEGCMRMKGPARSIDVNMLLYESEKMIDRQMDFMAFVEEQFQAMDGQGSPVPVMQMPSTPMASPTGHRRQMLREMLSQRRKDTRSATSNRLDKFLSERDHLKARRATPLHTEISNFYETEV